MIMMQHAAFAIILLLSPSSAIGAFVPTATARRQFAGTGRLFTSDIPVELMESIMVEEQVLMESIMAEEVLMESIMVEEVLMESIMVEEVSNNSGSSVASVESNRLPSFLQRHHHHYQHPPSGLRYHFYQHHQHQHQHQHKQHHQ